MQIHLRVDSRIAVVSFGIINLFPFYLFIWNAVSCVNADVRECSLLIKEEVKFY